MRTTHSTFRLAGTTVHQITFDPTTFTNADLLWLPHQAQLTDAGRKRKTEHLAGRLAAAHALRAINERAVPGIGPSGEPLWPEGITGSITHSGTQAMAVVARYPHTLIGIDLEAILSENEAHEIKEGVIDAQEETRLLQSGKPFALTLTLACSAKESLFKALFPVVREYMGFECARVSALNENTLVLKLAQPIGCYYEGLCFNLVWQIMDESVCTLLVVQE